MQARLTVDERRPRRHRERPKERLARYRSEYRAAVEEERFSDAASWAGSVAVILEQHDHPSAKSWWERQRRAEEKAS
jgi:hypothetical protein